MFGASINRINESVNAVKQHLITSENFRKFLKEKKFIPADKFKELVENTPDDVHWRVIDHCSSVTRLYALFEQFSHDMIKEYLISVERDYIFSELDKELQSNYRNGLSIIFSKKDGPRYGSLSLEALVSEWNSALTGSTTYRLEPAAMLIHEQNLRLDELCRLFKNCGISELRNWLEQHSLMKAFFKGQSRISDTVESELAQLISYRNDAAHGALSVDEVLGLTDLIELADFSLLLCQILAERVQYEIIERAVRKNKAVLCGKITENFKSGSVIIASVAGNFHVGQIVYIKGKNFCRQSTILSIQLDGKNLDSISIATAPKELGFALDMPEKKGNEIYALISGEIATAAAT